MMTEKLLQSAGHQVLTTRNGTEALVVAESFKPQAVLVDIGLPGEDGYQFIHKVRKHADENKNVPAIALTAFARSEARQWPDFRRIYLNRPKSPRYLAIVANLAGKNRMSEL